MIKVGLVGEDPNDTSAIKNLLEKRYKGKVQFKVLVRRITGDKLETKKFKDALRVEFEEQNCKIIICIRDLDAFKSQKDKYDARQQWFKELNKLINYQGLLLLNIWELEALIFGDISIFNKMYGIKYKVKGDPMMIKEPKEELKKKTFKSDKRKFDESHCPEIFKQLDIDKIEAKCSCFKDFIVEFEDRLKN